jgi:hypothetical protein
MPFRRRINDNCFRMTTYPAFQARLTKATCHIKLC